jgi:hypothetical protein
MNVEMPDGKVIAFPDSMGKAEIDTILNKEYGSQPAAPSEPEAPEWAGKYPNAYGLLGAGKALLRTGIETAGTTVGAAGGALVPVPGATLVGAGAGYAVGKRAANYLFDEPVDMSVRGVGTDVAVGAALQGAGSLLGKIPGAKRILSPSQADVGIASGKGTSKTLSKMAYNVAEKSLKVPPATKEATRQRAINTMLDEGIPITKGGLNRVKVMLDDLEGQMDAAISANPNAPIKIDDVLAPVNELRAKALSTVDGKMAAKKIDAIINRFRGQYGDEITVAEAQEIKQNTNAWLKKSYGELKPVTVEATKQIVRGLRDRIAAEIPEISGVNLKYGDLKVLEKQLERAVNRTGNWDWLGLIPSVGAATVGGATGNVAKASEAAMVIRILREPAIQSRIAIALKNAGVKKPTNAMAVAIADSIYNKMAGTDQTQQELEQSYYQE